MLWMCLQTVHHSFDIHIQGKNNVNQTSLPLLKFGKLHKCTENIFPSHPWLMVLLSYTYMKNISYFIYIYESRTIRPPEDLSLNVKGIKPQLSRGTNAKHWSALPHTNNRRQHLAINIDMIFTVISYLSYTNFRSLQVNCYTGVK